LPRELSDLASIVGGGIPRAWRFPWQEQLRVDDSQNALSRTAANVLAELAELLNRQGARTW
jgi:hypothetical protein